MTGQERDGATGKDAGTEPEKSEVGDSTTGPGPSVTYELYECPQCETTALAIHGESAGLSCCGKSMEPLDERGLEHTQPDVGQLLSEVYEMPKMTIDICHFVFDSGSVTVADTAEHFGYDRSTVSRYLRDLADAGFIERYMLNREQGGTVHVYQARDIQQTRRAELLALLDWTGMAARVMDEANEIKAMCAKDDQNPLDQVFWEVYEEKRTL